MRDHTEEKKTGLRAHRTALVLFFLFFGAGIAGYGRECLEDAGGSDRVTRAAEGGTKENRRFVYRTQEGGQGEVELDVSPVERPFSEAADLLEQAVGEWEKVYLGQNPSPDEVSADLNLPVQFGDGLVSVSYESSDYDILGADGEIHTANLLAEGATVELTAEFSYAGYSRRESRWLHVVLPPYGSAQWVQIQVERAARSAEENSRQQESFSLPNRVAGQALTWEKTKDSPWIWLIFVGFLAAFCAKWKEKEKKLQQEKERKARLHFEYPQMIDQISLLLDAGMPIRTAWGKILQTDQKMREQNGQKMREFIREMSITYREIREGCGEKEAYERFGERIGLIPYRRFGAILAQNLSRGTSDVRKQLQQEAKEALELRRNHARKMGEEAGTHMLFPMLLIFVLILLVLMLPAVQKF